MLVTNSLDLAPWLTVKQMLNTQVKSLYLENSLSTAIHYYLEYKVGTLPVVDENDRLIAVLPQKRLYRALLEGAQLDDIISPYVVYNPIFVSSELSYDEICLVIRVAKSKVDHVVVVDQNQKVAGMIGTAECLRESLNVIVKSTNLLESLFTCSNEGVIIVDNEGCIMRINPAAEEISGLYFSESKGKHLNEIFPEIPVLNKRLLGVKHFVHSIPVIVNQMPIIINGSRLGSIITLLDISDAEKAVQEEEIRSTLSGILEATSDGVIVSGNSGAIEYINESACQLLSDTINNTVGKPIVEVLNAKGIERTLQSGISEIEDLVVDGKSYIISHSPIKETFDCEAAAAVVSKIYRDNNESSEATALKMLSLTKQAQYYREELKQADVGENSFGLIFSDNPDFIAMKKDARHIARSSSTVLLTGESGVGKDMFARAIHAASPRSEQAFIKVNCAAIPETLFESELFGYDAGAFTGASKNGKPGYFEQADGGTIFLDEIGDMPLSIQVKILQVLQEREFMRVGGTSVHSVDVRVIAATNRELREAMAAGDFREDLFYRLNVIEFHLPSLRERPEDILALAHVFAAKYNQILGANVTSISQEAQKALANHSWPGNIRELENAIERAANYAWDGEIDISHLPPHLFQVEQKALDPLGYRSVLNDVDRKMIIQALKKTKGNKSAAARLLNISRSSFYDKLVKYNIS